MQDEVTQADALMQHELRMIDACANYLEPTTYITRHPVGELCKWNTEFPMPEATHTPEASAQINKRRDDAFIIDMIYMLDGPEQRKAFARHQAERDTLARIEWRDIESAPHACHVLATYLQVECGEWVVSVEPSPPSEPFTHWMPLPPAPEAGQ